MNDLSHQIPITEQLLPYVQLLNARDLSNIDLVVIHCTELPDLATARQYGERVLSGGVGCAAYRQGLPGWVNIVRLCDNFVDA